MKNQWKISLLFVGVILFLFSGKSPAKPAPEKQKKIEQKTTASSNPSLQGKETVNEEGPKVDIPQDKQQMIGLKTTTVAIKPLQKVIRTVGRIEYDERKVVTVNTKYEGWIEKLYVDYTGRAVRKGEPLAEIYSPELFATQQELFLAWKLKNQAKGEGISRFIAGEAETLIQAARQRLRLLGIREDQIQKIEETGQPIKTVTLFSPQSGTVLQKMAVQGMRIMPGEKLFDIADLSSVWVIADIYEMDLPGVNVGISASISLSFHPGKVYFSKVEYIYPTLSGDTRTDKIRFSLPNPRGTLKPQMFTDVTLRLNLGKRLSVPEEAVIDTGLRQIVYVDKGDGTFEPREIQTGLKANKMIEVIKGLRAGEKVASSGNFLIDSEAKLKGVIPRPIK